jgi:hypothetical protein
VANARPDEEAQPVCRVCGKPAAFTTIFGTGRSAPREVLPHCTTPHTGPSWAKVLSATPTVGRSIASSIRKSLDDIAADT